MSALIEAIKLAAAGSDVPAELKALVDKVIKDFEPTPEPAKVHPTEIFEYVTKRFHKKNHKVGVVVGLREGDKVVIGWSKTNLKAKDAFNLKHGIDLAKQRAQGLAPFPPTPPCMVRQLSNFSARCVRFFKGAKTIQLVG